MNDQELDELYRRAGDDDPTRPGEAVRQAILANAMRVAAQARGEAPRPAADRTRWRRRWWPAAAGTLLAAGLAALVLRPLFVPVSEVEPAPTAVGVPAVAAPAGGAAPMVSLDNSSLRSSVKRLTKPAPDVIEAPKSLAAPHVEIQARAEQQVGAQQQARADGARRLGAARALVAEPEVPPTGASLRRAAASGDLTQLSTELASHEALEARDPQGRTALMLAIEGGHAEAVALLLTHGADPNAVDSRNRTPLQVAIAGGDPAIVDALRRAGAR